MKTSGAVVVSFSILLAAFSTGSQATGAAMRAAGPADGMPVLSQHARNDVARCGTCHGEDGNARTPGIPSLAGQQPLYLVAAMHQYASGQRVSKVMNRLVAPMDESQVKSLSLYFASQDPVARKTTLSANVEAGRVASAACANCHGPDGISQDVAVPNLAGQDATYLVTRMNSYRGKTGHWGMPHRLIDLTGQDMRNVAVFFAMQTPRAASDQPHSVQAIASKCDRCHGVENPGMAAPKLTGQERNHLATVIRAYRNGTRGSSAMHSMTADYSDAAIDSIASWYAGPARK